MILEVLSLFFDITEKSNLPLDYKDFFDMITNVVYKNANTTKN